MIRLPYPPSLNRYLRHTGRTYKTKEATDFTRQAALAAKASGVRRIESDVSIAVVLHPKLTKKGKASGTLIDLDNALKVAVDSLNGIAYIDDCQIKHITASVGEPVQGGGLSIAVFSMGQGPASPAHQSELMRQPHPFTALGESLGK